MPSDLLSNEAAECNRLLEALPGAIMRASSRLQLLSVHDPAYLEADAEASKILTRISELLTELTATPIMKIKRKRIGNPDLREIVELG